MTDGLVKCWGPTQFGFTNVPEDVIFGRLSVGWWHACGLAADTGKAHCWGGTTGVGAAGQADVPDVEETYWDIATGQVNTCVVTHENKIRCWGKPNYIDQNIPDAYLIP